VIGAHLPVLLVVLPLLAAPLIVLVRRGTFAWWVALAVSWGALAIALSLAAQVAADGPISYAIGSWEPPWGIEYRIDAFNAFMLVLVAAVASVVIPYARVSVAAEIPGELHYLFYAMFSLCFAGLLGIAATGDAFNLFVFLEISSLSTYVLIALGRRRQALLASYQYLVMGTIGATFYVIGVGLLYLATGTLNLADMAERLTEVEDLRPVLTALAFISAGIGLKLAMFPVHFWLPNAYAYGPSAIVSFVAATATKVSVYVLMRFYFTVFDPSLLFDELPMREILLVLSTLAILIASLVAVFQTDLKRMFAYSSVAQIGYITLGVALANEPGLTAAISHLFNHGVTKGALFMLLGGVALRAGRTDFAAIAGLSTRMPLTAFGIVIAGLSLVGVPATAGFVSKWYLVLGSIELGAWWLAVLVVGSSLISLAYVWRFVEAAYLSAAGPSSVSKGEAPAGMLIPAFVLVAACVYFGLDTRWNIGAAREAAQLLMEGLN